MGIIQPDKNKWGLLVIPLLLCMMLAGCSQTQAAKDPNPVLGQQAFDIGTEAYVYGYPLVTMEMTRRVMTNVAKPEGTHAPMGQFRNMREYPNAAFRDVTAPNADTLYSVAWLDLTKGPYIFSIPDAKGRYYLMPMLDGWTNVFQDPGKRTTGTEAQKYAITGPGWKGTLPDGVTEYNSRTNLVWILGRTYCTGTPQDYKEVHAFQDQLSLVPLSAYGRPYTPPEGQVDSNIDMRTPVREQVNALDAVAYFKLLAKLMKDNPPAAEDAPIVARMARIGIVPGLDFDISKLDPATAKGLQGVPKAAFEKIAANMKNAGTLANGWVIPRKTGLHGTDYLQRATIAAFGLGANRPEDAVYPSSQVDANGQFFFVDNPLNRYTLSQRNKLKFNPDGSVDLYLQAANPGPAKESNWLPAPKDKFILMLRLYWPKENPPSILDGTWQPPAVRKTE